MNQPFTAPKAVSIDQAGQLLGICRSSVYKLFKTGELRFVQIGSRRVVPISSINEFLGEPVTM